MQLVEYLAKERLSWKQFAERCSLRKQTLSRVKLSQGGIKLETAGRIVDATLGAVSYDDLRLRRPNP